MSLLVALVVPSASVGASVTVADETVFPQACLLGTRRYIDRSHSYINGMARILAGRCRQRLQFTTTR